MKNKPSKLKTALRAGLLLLSAGLVCLVIKAVSPESIDADGILHEAFFLLPLGFGLLAAGLAVLAGCGIGKIISQRKIK